MPAGSCEMPLHLFCMEGGLQATAVLLWPSRAEDLAAPHAFHKSMQVGEGGCQRVAPTRGWLPCLPRRGFQAIGEGAGTKTAFAEACLSCACTE